MNPERLKWILDNLKYENGKVMWKICINRRSKGEAGMLVSGYRRIRVKGIQLSAHRIAWFLHYGVVPLKQIDHINGNRSDNRIENLREVSARMNACNRPHHRQGRIPGYTWDKSRKKYMSRAWVNGKKIFLGRFDTKEEAIQTYQKFIDEVTN